MAKIVACLPHFLNEKNAPSVLEQAVRDKKSMGSTSKRMYSMISDSYVTALFIYTILKRYKNLTASLMMGDIRALEVGVSKYIRDYQLDEMYVFTEQLHSLTCLLVEKANALDPGGRNFLQLEYDEKRPIFCSFGQPVPTHFLLLAKLDRLHIVSPCAEMIVKPSSHYLDLDAPFLSLFALIESLIRHLGATFEGCIGTGCCGEIFNRPFSPGGRSDWMYFEIIQPLDAAKQVRKMSEEELREIGGEVLDEKRGTQNVILEQSQLHFTVYKVREIFGRCLPKSNWGERVSFSWDVLHLVLSMIKGKGLIPIWLKDKRAEVIKRYFWGSFWKDATIYMYEKGLGKEDVYFLLEEMIAKDQRGKSKKHLLEIHDLPECPETHPLLTIAHHLWQDSDKAYGFICGMYEHNVKTRGILDYLMAQIKRPRFALIAEYFWLRLDKRVMISMYEQGMSKGNIHALLDDMFEKYTNGASREEVLKACPCSFEVGPHPLANVAGRLYSNLEREHFCWDMNFVGEEKILSMYESGMNRQEIQNFFVNAMRSLKMKNTEIEFLVREHGQGSNSFYEDFYQILGNPPLVGKSIVKGEQMAESHFSSHRLLSYLEHHFLWNMASNLKKVGILPDAQKQLIAMCASQTSKDKIDDFFTEIVYQSGVTNRRHLRILMGYSKLYPSDTKAIQNEIASKVKNRLCAMF